MLLRMRGLPPKTVVSSETGFLKAAENSDPNAIHWFEAIQLQRKCNIQPGYLFFF
jgi:hypothetical protein